MARRSALILATVAVLLIFAGNAVAAPAGNVVGVTGDCTVQSGGVSRPLTLGQPVQVGDTVAVGANGKLKLRMGDGSIVSLAANSQMTVAAYAVDSSGNREGATLSMDHGLLHAVVAPVDHVAAFEVKTAVGTAAVRSTDWFVEAVPGSDQVGVLAGSVVLTSAATGRSVDIPAHWGGRLEAGRDPTPPRVWFQREFDAFLARTD
jgi:hypothetical protein